MSNNNEGFSIEGLMSSLTAKFSCTLSTKSPKRRKLETPPLTPACLSFNEEEEEEEERKLETFVKKRCRFYKYDEEEEKWSTKIGGVCKAILGKDLRKGIDYGVVWLILKSDKGEELLSHAVEPNHFFRHEETNFKRFLWREHHKMYCLVFREEEDGVTWKENFLKGRAQTNLSWMGHYDNKKSCSNVTLRR